MKLQLLHEEYISRANRPLEFGGVPIKPKAPEAPILPMERWREVEGALYKTYRFRRSEDRNTFVMQLLAYESTTEHNAELRIAQDTVDVKVQTHDLCKVTEIDKEYAKYADVLFRGLIYASVE